MGNGEEGKEKGTDDFNYGFDRCLTTPLPKISQGIEGVSAANRVTDPSKSVLMKNDRLKRNVPGPSEHRRSIS